MRNLKVSAFYLPIEGIKYDTQISRGAYGMKVASSINVLNMASINSTIMNLF
jgi:hypothetical protein